MTSSNQKDLKGYLADLEKFLDLYLVKKAPSIPENIKEGIVKYGPYITIVGLFFSIPTILTLFGLGSLFSTIGFLGNYRLGLTSQIAGLVLLASVILLVLSVPGLFNQSASAWKLLFYSSLVNSLHSIITFNLGSFIIGTIVSLYVLFQIKSYYK